MTKVAIYEWQIVTGDGSCYKQASDPRMSLQDWVSDGIAQRVIFQAEGLPTIGFDVSRDTRVICHRHNDPDPDYRDFDQTHLIKEGREIKKQPRRHCQAIGYECDGLLILMLVDLNNGSIELLNGVTG